MRAVIVGVVAVAAVATACSSSGSPAGKGGSTDAPTGPAPTSIVPSSAAPSGGPSSAPPSTPPSAPGGTAPDLSARLLTAAEVGPGFVAQADDSPGSPPPCGSADSPTLDAQVPPAAKVKKAFVQQTPAAQVDEELTTYADQASAVKALGIGRTGLACTDGSLYATDGSRTAVTIGAPTSPQLGVAGVDESTLWTLDGSDFKGGLLVVRYRSTHLLVMTFLTDKATDTARLPDTNKIIGTALTKAVG